MDFGEFFTLGAREIVPLAWKKGLLFLFDVRGPSVAVSTDAQAMHGTVQRLTLSALDLLDDGFVFLMAQTDMLENGTADLSVSIAGTGQRADDARVAAALKRLGMQERPMAQTAAPDGAPPHDAARLAFGTCPDTGATLSFVSNRSDGLLFTMDINVPARLIETTEPPPNAGGARAWLVADRPLMYQSLIRRLQRLGWATSSFRSAQEAAEQLAQLAPGTTRPRLVVGAESSRVTLDDMRMLRTRLPASTHVVLAAAIDSSTRTTGLGVELRHWPMGPSELEAFTRDARSTSDVVSGQTLPAPLTFPDRPNALVVDDNAVNLLVASGLLQLAGFEVDTATNGAQAVARCRERPPHVVLMDVHMPEMDGVETTHQLRELQRRGALPHFPIVAATADVAFGDAACRDAGMDGFMSKPLSLQALQRELQRVMPAHACMLPMH